jgi:hypothetical protein
MPAKSSPPESQQSRASSDRPAPLRTLRLGRLKATVWENEPNGRKMHNVTFCRTYMDEQKKFHDTDTFGRDDLLLLGKLADQAHTVICERLASERDEQSH